MPAGTRARFAGRNARPMREWYERFFASQQLAWADVEALGKMIQFEYGIPVGLLRPEDSLRVLWLPVPTRRPWRSLVFQMAAADREASIIEDVDERLRHLGTRAVWDHPIHTVNDLMCAWGRPAPVSHRNPRIPRALEVETGFNSRRPDVL